MPASEQLEALKLVLLEAVMVCANSVDSSGIVEQLLEIFTATSQKLGKTLRKY